MNKPLLIATAISGILAVSLGAFGAHGLKTILTPEQLNMWEKAVQYQFYHTLCMLVCVAFLSLNNSNLLRSAVWCFLAGIILFSGSLYLLATRQLTDLPVAILGPVTPMGGVLFIAGWSLILAYAIRGEKAT